MIGRRLSKQNFFDALMETGQITAMLMVLLIGAEIFMRFLAISKLPFALAEFINGIALPNFLVLAVIVFIYFLLGMFLDIVSSVILTVPIFFPTILAMGYDPIWFGVVIVLVQEMGLITPPVGMNAFVLAGVSHVPVGVVFRGVLPFVLAMFFCIIIITIFPQIALFLPNMMK